MAEIVHVLNDIGNGTLLQVMRMHVMDNVRQRIEAGHRDFVNEIRVCTVLFLGLPSLQVRPLQGDRRRREEDSRLFYCFLRSKIHSFLHSPEWAELALVKSKSV